jgi:hypothetical protein
MTITTSVICLCIMLCVLGLVYFFINASISYRTMQDVKPNLVRLKRTTYSEKELATKDYKIYSSTLVISAIGMVQCVLSGAGMFYVLLQLIK